jgi:hypothetical protein
MVQPAEFNKPISLASLSEIRKERSDLVLTNSENKRHVLSRGHSNAGRAQPTMIIKMGRSPPPQKKKPSHKNTLRVETAKSISYSEVLDANVLTANRVEALFNNPHI